MSSVYPIRLARLTNFARNVAEGLDEDWAGVDSEINQILVVLGQLSDLVKTVVTPAGALQFTQALREMDLIEVNEFTATASQTAFTVEAYDTATDKVNVYRNGALLKPSTVTLTNSTTVTIPASTVGDIIVIEVYSAGAGVLTKLAATTVNLGASLIGIYDSGALYSATTAEAAFAEVMTKLNTLITNVGTIANYIKKDGSVAMTAALAMGTHKITGGSAATNPTDFVIYSQLTAYTSVWDNLSANYLPKGGGTLSGTLNMGSHPITNVTDPSSAQDAATKAYVDAQLLSVNTPIGAMLMWPASALPSANWLVCDGSAVSRLTYATLNSRLAADGYPFGSGDGSTTFNLPDFRGRVPVGAGTGSGLTARALGGSGGEELHTLLTAEAPPHTHEIHTNGVSTTGTAAILRVGGAPDLDINTGNGSGSATPHNNMQPWRGVHFIIRVT